MKESDLGNDLLTYYKQMPNTEIYCEVQCAGIIDMVVKAGNIITAIECKMSFGLAVIEQAVKNTSYSHYSYVAVPKARRGFIERVCKDYGIGVLTVSSHTFQGVTEVSVTEVVAAKFNRRIVKPRLEEYQLLNTPGVQNERWTSWGWFVESLQTELKRRPDGATHEELFNSCYRHYDRPAYLKNNLLTYIRSGVIKNVEYRDKRFHYRLTPT